MSDADRPALLVCFDDAYAPAAAVTLDSLFRNNPDLDAELYAAVSAIQPERLLTVERLCADFGHAITFLEMDEGDYRHFKTVAHISQAAYFRILAIDRIRAGRILYLDVDLIVQTDLAPLLALAMGGRLIAGVATERPPGDALHLIGVDDGEPYLNTGVLLIDAAQ